MSNERNVAALRHAIEQASFAMYQGVPVPLAEVERIRATSTTIALCLAAKGVLVPRAISPKQMRQIGQWIEGETAGDSYDDEAYRVCVGLLEQVAQGNALIETEGSS